MKPIKVKTKKKKRKLLPANYKGKANVSMKSLYASKFYRSI